MEYVTIVMFALMIPAVLVGMFLLKKGFIAYWVSKILRKK